MCIEEKRNFDLRTSPVVLCVLCLTEDKLRGRRSQQNPRNKCRHVSGDLLRLPLFLLCFSLPLRICSTMIVRRAFLSVSSAAALRTSFRFNVCGIRKWTKTRLFSSPHRLQLERAITVSCARPPRGKRTSCCIDVCRLSKRSA